MRKETAHSRGKTAYSKQGIWLSFDLMLTFLFLFSLLSGLLTPVLLEKTYSYSRAEYNERLSIALGLSEQAYVEAANAPAQIPFQPPFAYAGYFDANQLADFQSHLPSALQNWTLSDALPPSSSSSRICVKRLMIDSASHSPRALRVCER